VGGRRLGERGMGASKREGILTVPVSADFNYSRL
jgi:hypothetical protein